MAHNIPKIEYGGMIPTVIEFPYPAVSGMGQEISNIARKRTTSLSGVEQSQLSHIERIKKLNFGWVSEELYAKLQAFVESHAALGKSFRYYENKNSLSYVNCTFDQDKLEPKSRLAKSENSYLYDVSMQFRRVVDQGGDTSTMQAELLNNQAAPVDLEGASLDSTAYKTVRVYYEIFRETSLEERVGAGDMLFVYQGGTWQLSPGTYEGAPGASGVEFSVDGEQIQYVTDDMAGDDYVGYVKFKNFVFEA